MVGSHLLSWNGIYHSVLFWLKVTADRFLLFRYVSFWKWVCIDFHAHSSACCILLDTTDQFCKSVAEFSVQELNHFSIFKLIFNSIYEGARIFCRNHIVFFFIVFMYWATIYISVNTRLGSFLRDQPPNHSNNKLFY